MEALWYLGMEYVSTLIKGGAIRPAYSIDLFSNF